MIIFFDRSACGDYSPVILDSDGALRWVSPLPTLNALFAASTFFDNAVYIDTRQPVVRESSLMGRSSWLQTIAISARSTSIIISIPVKRDYSLSRIPRPTSSPQSWKLISTDGHVLKTFNMADIISAAMIAGGDDPSQFVFPTPTDWFHNNGAVYNRADDSAGRFKPRKLSSYVSIIIQPRSNGFSAIRPKSGSNFRL